MKIIEKIQPDLVPEKRRKRVAAYARVSRDTDRLLHSVSAQISYYSNLIQSNPEWEYAGAYADSGITGARIDCRSEYLRLMQDCEKGLIDIILVKSISRFARNTVDLLNAVRHLKELRIEVRFEKENINSLSSDGELMLSIPASFAQEGSRSISENVKWGIRKRFQNGTIGTANKHILGYRFDEEQQKYVIIPEEAETVRWMFQMFLDGLSYQQIADQLNNSGIRTILGNHFYEKSIKDLIYNEIYAGDLRRQKTHTPDPIPASISRFTSAPMQQKSKRRVAAYARVSTDRDEQLTSYEAQVAYYTDYINSRSDWEFAGIYSDSGITGCNTKKRVGFNQMIEDALAGKFSLIITKSVSRFARNTVDSLTNIRKLKEHGVECYFEKENIWTFDSKGELLLTIMSSIAQEESRSISENCTWGQRRRFEEGKVSVPFKRFLGYDKGKDGELVVNPEQAKIVRRIYAEFLKGKSPYLIAKDLTADEIPTPGGKAKWTGGVIRSILQNEKYKGDALLQKVFTPDYLTKKKIKNEGQVPQYYVRGDHEAIIEPQVFELVQRQIKQRKSGSRSNVSIFSGKLICGDCGSYYGSKVWHSNDKYRKVIWQCNHKFQGKKCTTPTLSETEIKELFIRALNKLITCKSEIIASYEDIKGTIFATEALEQVLAEITDKMKETDKKMAKLIIQNASYAVDQAEYDKKYAKLTKVYDSLLMRRNNVAAEITEKQEKEKDMQRFLEKLKTLDTATEFEDEIWVLLLDSVTIHSQGNADFKFVDGTVISVEHENN